MNYLSLIKEFELRPIQDDEQFWQYHRRMDWVIDQIQATEDEVDLGDYLHLIGLLIEEYETLHGAIPPV